MHPRVLGWSLVLAATGAHAAAVSGVVRIDRPDGPPVPAWRAAVLLEPEQGGVAPPGGQARLDTVWLSFVPKVQVLPVGTRLAIDNHDEAAHTVEGRLGAELLFDRANPPGGRPQEVLLDRPGVITVTCAIHPEMRGFLVVASPPLHALTDEDGRFVLANVPPGRYRVRGFHEDALPPAPGEPGLLVAAIEVPPGAAPLAIDLHLAAPAQSTTRAPGPAIDRSRPRVPRWMRQLGESDPGWPRGRWLLPSVALALIAGLGLAWAGARAAYLAGLGKIGGLGVGCLLAFLAGVSGALGLSGAVATALGSAIFIGAVLVAAAPEREPDA